MPSPWSAPASSQRTCRDVAVHALLRTAQPDMSSLTSSQPKMILTTYKIDAHPAATLAPWLPRKSPAAPHGLLMRPPVGRAERAEPAAVAIRLWSCCRLPPNVTESWCRPARIPIPVQRVSRTGHRIQPQGNRPGSTAPRRGEALPVVTADHGRGKHRDEDGRIASGTLQEPPLARIILTCRLAGGGVPRLRQNSCCSESSELDDLRAAAPLGQANCRPLLIGREDGDSASGPACVVLR
jgi:hypothetical protein